jgi:uncharacterized damage-inducible protein DinB
MSLSQSLLPEFDQEMAGTRRVLERVPAEKLSWKPHDKSMPFDRLAVHVAELPSWTTMTLTTSELDFAAAPYAPTQVETTQDLLNIFDKATAEARTALAGVSDEELFKPWTLRNGEHQIFSLPKIAVLRSFVMNHIIHHRAQLTVYLRLNDVPVPGLYGPSADEGNF